MTTAAACPSPQILARIGIGPLTGRPPYQRATVLETIDLVQRQEPVPPRQLSPRIPRDLETICLKCLHKEPGRRYLSAEALAGDLGQNIDNLAAMAGTYVRVS
jgi:eukaryotic-like serine/threonine-protein kinase